MNLQYDQVCKYIHMVVQAYYKLSFVTTVTAVLKLELQEAEVTTCYKVDIYFKGKGEVVMWGVNHNVLKMTYSCNKEILSSNIFVNQCKNFFQHLHECFVSKSKLYTVHVKARVLTIGGQLYCWNVLFLIDLILSFNAVTCKVVYCYI